MYRSNFKRKEEFRMGLSLTNGFRLGASACIAVLCMSCSLGGGGSTSEGSPTELSLGTDSAARIQPVIDAFQKANHGITIKVTESGQGDYVQFMQPRIASSTGPDIIRAFPGRGNALSIGPLAKAGAIVDLSGESWASSLTVAQKSLFGQNGKVFSVPMGSIALGPVYNQQVLSGLGVGVPQTWSDVMNLCQVAKSKGKSAYSLFQKGGSILTSYALSAPLVYGPHPEFTQLQYQNKASFATSGWVDVFQRQLEMLKAGCFNDHPNGTDYNAATNLIVTGKAAGIVLFTDVSGLTAIAPAGTTFVMGPQPIDDNPDDAYLAVADAYAFTINAKSKNVNAAKKFLAYLATADAQNAFAKATGGGPAIGNTSFKGETQTEQLLAQYVASKHTGVWPDQDWPSGKVAQALIDGTQNLFDGVETPTQLAADMDKAFKNALGGS